MSYGRQPAQGTRGNLFPCGWHLLKQLSRMLVGTLGVRERDCVEDDEHGSAITDQNIAKVRDMILGDRRLTVRAVTELVNGDNEAVRRILTDAYHMKKICEKVVPKILSDDHMQYRKNLSVDILENIANEPNLLEHVGTCDETRSFTYEPEIDEDNVCTVPIKAKTFCSLFKEKKLVIDEDSDDENEIYDVGPVMMFRTEEHHENILDSLLNQKEIDPFLKRLTTADEKWIDYSKVNQKISWVVEDEPAQTTSKAEIHQTQICAVSLVIL
ncbi:putative mariner transposase [Trichonephila clavipes]|nr:putative mariner transposase [Trichonephila clavipes]